MSTFDPDALECLAAIIEEGGFERAAQRLSITQSAVSQRLRALEAQVGTVLIVRSRPLKPTQAGQLMLKHAKMMRLLRADPLAQGGLPIEIITDDQEFTHEWLREGQVLGCVTSLGQALRGCKMEPLGTMDYVAVAAANFAARHCPKGVNAHNFHKLPFIAFNRKDHLQHSFVEQAFGLQRVMLKQLFVPSSEGQIRAVRAGWGVSVVPELGVRELLDSGELVNVTPRHRLGVALYWHCWNLSSDVLDALSGALRGAAAQSLRPA